MKKLEKVKAQLDQNNDLELKKASLPREAEVLARKYMAIGWPPIKAIRKAKNQLLLK
jgi:hypothetical protein